jgi:hypothetical protein
MREPIRGAGWLRALSVVDGLLAALAVWGGISLIVGAPGFRMPVEWLDPVGLDSWVLPGIALIVLIGGVMGWAAVAGWRGTRHAPGVSLAAAAVLFGWLAVQLLVIGARAPVQVVTALMGLLVVVLACGSAARRKAW